jgi:hypothetical protein
LPERPLVERLLAVSWFGQILSSEEIVSVGERKKKGKKDSKTHQEKSVTRLESWSRLASASLGRREGS